MQLNVHCVAQFEDSFLVKVSLIVPVYNAEEYLKISLNCLINQTLKDIEIICVDDGSTDNSLKILEEYSKKDSRIKFITQKNSGPGVARNNGIKIAKGEYLAFPDSDDEMLPEMYETLYNTAKAHNADLVECNYFRYNNKLRKAKLRFKMPENTIFNWQINHEYPFRFGRKTPWNKFVKREFVIDNNIKFADTYYSEDHLFTITTRILAQKVVFINKYLYIYKYRSDSACHKKFNSFVDVLRNYELIKVFIQEKHLEDVFSDYVLDNLCREFVYIYNHSDEAFYPEIEKAVKEYLPEKYQINFYKLKDSKGSILQTIFSVKNSKDYNNKIITILGLQFKIKRHLKNSKCQT